eukprot:scpid94294/ scgid2685/ 
MHPRTTTSNSTGHTRHIKAVVGARTTSENRRHNKTIGARTIAGYRCHNKTICGRNIAKSKRLDQFNISCYVCPPNVDSRASVVCSRAAASLHCSMVKGTSPARLKWTELPQRWREGLPQPW